MLNMTIITIIKINAIKRKIKRRKLGWILKRVLGKWLAKKYIG